MKDKYKYLIKNIGLLTISRFGTSLLSFFLVPLYTSVLSTKEYGSYDIINSTVHLLIPILTINIAASVFRFAMDDKKYWSDIISVGIRYLIVGTCILGIVILINNRLELINVFSDYWLYTLLMFISAALYEIVSNFSRGLEKIREFSIAGIITTITMISLNVFFLLIIKIGLDGYFLANIISSMISSAYLLFSTKIVRYLVLRPNLVIKKEMTKYSIPLIANTVGWWVTNTSDRYAVTLLCGIATNGVYSVSYKIPTILTVFQTIFSQAWVISAIKDFDANDSSGFFSKIYNMYNYFNVILCSILILFCRNIAKILYAKDFYEAWKYVPFLLISVVFGGMTSYFGCIFSATKQAKIFGRSTVVGAIINLLLNFLLIDFIGPNGAAIATAVSYLVVWVIRLVHVKKLINLEIHIVRDCILYGCLVVQAVTLQMCKNILYTYLIQIVMIALILVCARDEIVCLVDNTCKLIKNRTDE